MMDDGKLALLQRCEVMILTYRMQMEGMIAENKQREVTGQSMAFVENDFLKLMSNLEKTYQEMSYYL